MEWQQGGPSPAETTYTQQGRPPMPKRLCERRTLRNYSNGIGLATLGYIFLASVCGSALLLVTALLSPVIYLRGKQFFAPQHVTQLIYITAYLVSLTVPFLVYMSVIKIPAQVALPFRRADPVMTLGGAAAGMALAAVANRFVDLLQQALEAVGVYIVMPQAEVPTEPLAYALYALLLTVLPAVFEEAVFRGVLMQSLRRFGDGFALIMSSLIFGIYHLNLMQMPFAFILGLCLGYFTLRTGSMWCAVLIHLLNNTQSLLAEHLFMKFGEKTAVMAIDSMNIFWLALGGFALCLMLARDRNLFTLNPPACSLPSREKVRVFWTSPLMIAALITAALFTAEYVSLGSSSLAGLPLW